MIYVFTGNGKGKTTAALGIGLRAVGAGKKVLMIQFLKPGNSSENKVIEKMDNFVVKSFGREGFFVPQSKLEENPELKQQQVKAFEAEDRERAERGLRIADQRKDEYQVVILDEINLALHYNLLKEEKVLNFLRGVNDTHLILTGRYCPGSVKEEADLVTDCKEVKHYYHQGQGPIKGIDL